MANMFDLKHHRDVWMQLRDCAEDPDLAEKVISFLDENPEIRSDLAPIYIRARNTLDLEARRLQQIEENQ